MNIQLKRFLDEKRKLEEKKYEAEKRRTLIELDLIERVYSENQEYTSEFPYSDYDSDSGKTRWYKTDVIAISDEEYEELKKCLASQKAGKCTNSIAVALTVIAWIVFIGGFIAGIALGTVTVERGYYYTYTTKEFSFAIAFIYWCVSLISGTVFLGLAEVIKLLDAIKKK